MANKVITGFPALFLERKLLKNKDIALIINERLELYYLRILQNNPNDIKNKFKLLLDEKELIFKLINLINTEEKFFEYNGLRIKTIKKYIPYKGSKPNYKVKTIDGKDFNIESERVLSAFSIDDLIESVFEKKWINDMPLYELQEISTKIIEKCNLTHKQIKRIALNVNKTDFWMFVYEYLEKSLEVSK